MSGAAATTPAAFHYRLNLPASGHFPGAHRSPRGDTGMEFRTHVPLQQANDARRLDIHASLRDPSANGRSACMPSACRCRW